MVWYVRHRTPGLLPVVVLVFFFFQAEDGIRDLTVTGVQTCALPISNHAVIRAPNDRALQDDVIRALADAPYRASADWRRRALADPDRMDRYARFLARHFYYERIVHFFKYSRALARVTSRAPEGVLKSPAFDALLPALVLGSRETASAVARLVTAHVAVGAVPVPYLFDLLRYEAAMMVVEAGPPGGGGFPGPEEGGGGGDRPGAGEGHGVPGPGVGL